MSDLISRSELLKAFNNKNVQITFDLPVEEVLGEDVDLDDFAMLVQDAIQAYKKMAIDTIKNQPTAYDIDKVVTELNELDITAIKRYEGGTFGNYEGTDYYIKQSDAIEIVKQGGVDDDVCEWEKGSSGYVGYPAYYSKCCTTNSNGLEMQTHIISDWKYCPYCGKKILRSVIE